MSVTVRIPQALRPITGAKAEVSAEGETITELLDGLEARFEGIRAWVCDSVGALRPYVNISINRKDARTIGGLSARVAAGDCVSIIPAVAGGAPSVRKIYLTFPQELIKEPIVFRLGHEFNVVTSVKAASVTNNIGFVALDLEGEPAELDRAIAWLKDKGVKVEPLENE